MNAPTPEEEAELERSKAPLLEHLVELRGRIIRSLLVFFAAFLLCYFFAKDIYGFLVQPLADALAGQPNRHMIFTALYETFFTYVKVAMFGAICVAFPYIAAQLWLFIAPGLYKNERRAFLPFLFASARDVHAGRQLRLLPDAALCDPVFPRLRKPRRRTARCPSSCKPRSANICPS